MKTDLDRRTFLLGTSSTLSLSLLPFEGWAIPANTAKDPVPPAPVARVEVVKDTYFGETLSDPYRWMENGKDPRLAAVFERAERAHPRHLDALPRPRGPAQAHRAALRRTVATAACSAPAV